MKQRQNNDDITLLKDQPIYNLFERNSKDLCSLEAQVKY